MSTPEHMVYVGRDRRCNCIYMVTVDNNRPDRCDDIATAVAEVIRAGDIIERMTLDAYKASSDGGCVVCQPSEQEALPL